MSARGIFHDDVDARAVVAALRRDGWTATLAREPLAGEDDDEDHPWAVTTDAPEAALDILCEVHEGWLDVEPSAPPASPLRLPMPLPLPDAPRRLKADPAAPRSTPPPRT